MPTIKEKTIRTAYMHNKLWFVTTDVAEALGVEYTPEFADYVPVDEGRMILSIDDQFIEYIVETGAYAIMVENDYPKGHEFAKWVILNVHSVMWYFVHIEEKEGALFHTWKYDF